MSCEVLYVAVLVCDTQDVQIMLKLRGSTSYNNPYTSLFNNPYTSSTKS